jgi:hypothetical protein
MSDPSLFFFALAKTALNTGILPAILFVYVAEMLVRALGWVPTRNLFGKVVSDGKNQVAANNRSERREGFIRLFDDRRGDGRGRGWSGSRAIQTGEGAALPKCSDRNQSGERFVNQVSGEPQLAPEFLIPADWKFNGATSGSRKDWRVAS